MKSLACRLAFAISIAVFGTYILLILFGMISSALGAGDVFYCSVYCQIGLGVLIAGVAFALYTQVRAWLHEPREEPPHLPA